MSVDLTSEFGALWETGDSPPDVLSFLREHAQASLSDKLNVLLRDQQQRWTTEQPLSVEDYLAQFPELANHPELKLQLAVGEFQARQKRGRQPDIDQFAHRFADLSAALKSQLPILCPNIAPDGHDPYVTTSAVPVAPVDVRRIGRYRLERLLGQGAFGRVWLAFDEDLQRQVAIKLPTPERFQRPEDAEAYLAEARMVAGLDHPHIVPVYDVGRTDDGSVYVVSKFIEGCDLAEQIKRNRPASAETASLIATVAQALDHAHQKRLIHRDIKPANILLEDRSGTPYVADFGLAISEENYLRDSRLAGTPGYMSPEQARGEGHRLDGRSDIFSVGVVLYETLTGKRPFQGSTANELLHQVITVDPAPLRDWDSAIPAELERICLKALSKRASDRYATAAQLADDLLHWNHGPQHAAQELTIVPKGLRSFDADDADSFLALLPGPRTREGLPESIQFWKSRIEEADADQTFSVGLIYGPSGCGKTSLVKAGLLPRLSRDVIAIYVEATPEETEIRVLRSLRKRLPDLSPDLGLVAAFAALRRREGPKVVVILDQFEQWLHAHKAEPDAELVNALRQCDGGQLQVVIMVRDDFAMAASRFMNSLDIPIVQGHNFATVDLFDIDHAQKVLAKFGQAFGKLPAQLSSLSNPEKKFLALVAAGLAQDGKVVSVRLALFAEMVKAKPWIPATLDQVGGAAGVGVNFLEETFCSRTANPKHRFHQEAARAVLKTLLPDVGTNIKGNMRSHADLLAASGYQDRPQDFHDLLRVLDGELRLITPTDPEGMRSESGSDLGSKYYQLTHDYLVPSLRDWLTIKQKETRQGRAELRLAERAHLWNARPENQQLPALWEFLSIRMLTNRKEWSEPQRLMMRKAGRVQGLRSSIAAALMIGLGVLGLGIRNAMVERENATRAEGLVAALINADTNQAPAIVSNLNGYRTWADPLLETEFSNAPTPSRRKLHASLALLPVNPEHKDYLFAQLLDANPLEVPIIRDALAPRRAELTESLWNIVQQPSRGKESQRLRAACALATYAPDDPRWTLVQTAVVDDLVKAPSVHLAAWMESLRPVRARLVPPLADVFRNETRTAVERSLATDILADYVGDDLETLADLVMDADEQQFPLLFPKLQGFGDRGAQPLLAALTQELEPAWTDGRPGAEWKAPEVALARQIEAAHGILAEAFAFCQTMPLDQFTSVADALRTSGYRPIRFRPYPAGSGHQVAAVWTRDGDDWRLAHGLSREELLQHDAEYRKQSLDPIDVSVCVVDDRLQYAALWGKTSPNARATTLQIALAEKPTQPDAALRMQAGDRIVAYAHAVNSQGLSSTVVVGAPAPGEASFPRHVYFGPESDYSGENHLGELQVDVQVQIDAAGKPDRWYAAAWRPSTEYTSIETHGLDPEDHLSECRLLVKQGYRPTSVSVAAGRGGQLVAASVWRRPVVSDAAKENLARRQATAAVALLRMGRGERIWPLLQHSSDPRTRSYLIHRFSSLGADDRDLAMKLDAETDPTIRRALVLAWGEHRDSASTPKDHEAVVALLQRWRRDADDPGLRAAAEWTLRQQGQGPWLQRNDEQWTQDRERREARQRQIRDSLTKGAGQPQWHVNGQGQTMVVIPGPTEFFMGSPTTEARRLDIESLHRRRIGRSYAIAAKLVTVEQFRRFHPEHANGDDLPRFAAAADCPILATNWYEAAEYCNWLSKQEGLPETEWCYEPNADGHFAEGMRPAQNHLERQGYRLPTEAEWEHACRAGAATSRYYGETDRLLPKYGVFQVNSGEKSWPVGSLKPNDLGLFDMYGNVWQWCDDPYRDYALAQGGRAVEDVGDASPVLDVDRRVLRGGGFYYPSRYLRSAYRYQLQPGVRLASYGFRVARTWR